MSIATDTYTIEVSGELARQYTGWTRIRDLKADWFKVELREDGTAEVLLQIGEKPRT